MELENTPQLRASDADRDRVAEILGDALSEGRLTPEEHSERLDRLYAAKTYAELEPLTGDLPRPKVSLSKEEPSLPPPVRGSSDIQCFFGAAERKGRWLVEPVTTVNCVFGGVDLDYRTAVLTQREVVVNVSCIFGAVDVVVPPGVRVESNASAIFGAVDDPGNDTVDPHAPVIRFTGFILFGALTVKRKLTREQRRAQRAARRSRHHL
ncbi:DUF1707 domain-containing protein [Actinocorallia sp. B10E7]|uniref:DUF1707 SHOCT-like domain-containing protein n=1 Tax=Actinocorallia sp. B10E7 TaxID=3153558 RepID=UPI00325C5CFB